MRENSKLNLETFYKTEEHIKSAMNTDMFSRIAPFILFMCFIGIEEIGRFLVDKGVLSLTEHFFFYLYPIKAISVAIVLFCFRKRYKEIELHQLLKLRFFAVSIFCGGAVFAAWIQMDSFSSSIQSSPGYNPLQIQSQSVQFFLIFIRLAGAVLVVPLMEELFWRSFFIRYLINQKFTEITVGQFTWSSFIVTTLLFGLEHNLFFAGIMAGAAYNLLLYYTRSIAFCILAHAVTNLLLGIYVLATHQWHFW